MKSHPHIFLYILLALGLIFIAISPTPAQAAGVIVDLTEDELDGADAGACLSADIADYDGDGGELSDISLREAICWANANPGADVITLSAGSTYHLSIVGAGDDANLTGDLDILEALTIQTDTSGTSAIIDANNIDRVINIPDAGGDLTLIDLTLQNGTADAASLDDGGGGILVKNGDLTLTRVALTNNTVTGDPDADGGGLQVDYDDTNYTGTITITDSAIANNTSSDTGGGIFFDPAGTGMTVNISGSTISGNQLSEAGNDGGGINLVCATATPVTLTILNSTISGNSATDEGGGIFWSSTYCTVEIGYSTIANNSAELNGGGIHSPVTGTSFNVYASILADNTIVSGEGPDCNGTITSSAGHNLIEDATTCTLNGTTDNNIIGIDPGLAALNEQGGYTQTHAISYGAAPHNTIANGTANCGTTITTTTDQRGEPRPFDTACDMGAYETQSLSPDDFVITVKTDNTGASTDTQFTIPTYFGETYNYNVDCDNDNVDEVTGATENYTCNYASAGTYTIRIKDNVGDGTGFPRIYFKTNTYSGSPRIYGGDTIGGQDEQKLLSIEQWGSLKWTSMEGAFAGCINLAGQANDTPDLSNLTDLSNMFLFAVAFNQDISAWDTSNVTNMQGMFSRAQAFNQDISNWNTSNVTSMEDMFSFASVFNQNIGKWDTSSLTNITSMFSMAGSFDQNLGGWDVSQITSAEFIFNENDLSLENYDALLNGWAAQTVQNNVIFGGGNSKYCAGETGHNTLTDTYGWTITDGGKDCPLSKAPADFDGDGSSDLSFYRPSTGYWFVKNQFTPKWGRETSDIPVACDYDGNGTQDIAIFRSSYWLPKDQIGAKWGESVGDIPVPADYDGDGVCDIAVYRPSTGIWLIKDQNNFIWGGTSEDIPVPADYDGDGVIDLAIYRPSTGMWLVKDQFNVVWGGGADDIPIPGDYDGNGTDDLAIYRSSTGMWLIKDQSNISWGGAVGDVPVPGDYDGDGVWDIAIFRSSTGWWMVKDQFSMKYGADGDFPLPARDTNGDGDVWQ